MSVSVKDLIKDLPDGIYSTVTEEDNNLGQFIFVDPDNFHDGIIRGIKIIGLQRWLALARKNTYWMEPFFGKFEFSIPKETQYLLWERNDGRYGILLPLIDGDFRTSIMGDNEGLSFVFNGALNAESYEKVMLAFVGIGQNPYELTYNAVKVVENKIRSFRMRDEKPQPDFVDLLGWCTWDAFYRTVDEEKIFDGLQSFKEGGVQVGFMILDDGWLDVKDDFLNDFAVDPNKFPSGLHSIIERAKEVFNIKMFGLWHAFEGYWGGINPKGKIGKKYRIIPTEGVIRPWEGKVDSLFFMDPKDSYYFFNEFYRFLHKEGVDLLKVDGQSALEIFSEGKFGRVSTMRTYQEAMQGAAQNNFQGNIIHCMCNSTDVAYNMLSTTVWRNSDDYFPNKPANIQQRHIFVNAMNNLFTSTFSLPDWDMFQSHNPESEFHAAARAISGGPIYLCDKPGMQNFDLINKLCITGGRVLRCSRPALPARDILFTNCMNEPRLLKVTNVCGPIGVLGLFNCQENGSDICDSFNPSDIEDISGDVFAVYFYKTGRIEILKRNSKCNVSLRMMDYEIITISPITNGVAPIGLLDKFSSAAVFDSWEQSSVSNYIFHLKDGGERIGFYCENKPQRVLVNGKEVTSKYDCNTGLLITSGPKGSPLRIDLVGLEL